MWLARCTVIPSHRGTIVIHETDVFIRDLQRLAIMRSQVDEK